MAPAQLVEQKNMSQEDFLAQRRRVHAATKARVQSSADKGFGEPAVSSHPYMSGSGRN